MFNIKKNTQLDAIIIDGVNANVREESAFKWSARISAVAVGVLLVIFFVMVIHTTSVINNQVKYIKDGPYPISVAAGHIETNLVRLETVIEHISTTQLAGEENLRNAYDDAFAEILQAIEDQVYSVDTNYLHNPEIADRFLAELDLLKSRLAVFTVRLWHDDSLGEAQYENVTDYVNEYLYPVIDYLILINADVLDQTTKDVDDMYTTVDAALSSLFFFAIVMLMAVCIMIVIYTVSLNLKTRFENELRWSLTQALEATREANRAKSAFLSNMSHDIRTPMNAIVGLTAIADDNIDDKLRVKQCLTRISTASQHLLSLINDVLDMNKIESGKVTLAQEEFSLALLVAEIEMIIRSQPDSKKLKTEVDIHEIDHDLLIGDTMRLRQILLNLTSNALKYTNEGDTMKLIVRESPTSRLGYTRIVFVVADTGIGMKSEFIQRIFEPFEREDNDFIAFTKGTGLGMAITKNLVDLMDGTIAIESEPGVGTTVTIEIDFKLPSEERVAERKAMRKASMTKHAHGSVLSGRVLVVEDNEINMEIAKTLISERGASVEGAEDGLKAVKMVADAPEGYYDLIFMDWQMPHMNGIEATKAIRSFLVHRGRGHIPIVAMTANAFDSDRAEALEAGMDDFMAKPINIHQLEIVLEKYLPVLEDAQERACSDANTDATADAKSSEASSAAVASVDTDEESSSKGESQ